MLDLAPLSIKRRTFTSSVRRFFEKDESAKTKTQTDTLTPERESLIHNDQEGDDQDVDVLF